MVSNVEPSMGFKRKFVDLFNRISRAYRAMGVRLPYIRQQNLLTMRDIAGYIAESALIVSHEVDSMSNLQSERFDRALFEKHLGVINNLLTVTGDAWYRSNELGEDENERLRQYCEATVRKAHEITDRFYG
jgi:hypothetical protein